MNIFRHGPGITKENLRADRLRKTLTKPAVLDYCCGDVQMGMSLDLREVVLCAVDQNTTFVPDLDSVKQRIIPGPFFEHLDDDMHLRLLFVQHMQKSNWQIPVKVKHIKLNKDCFNLLSVQIIFDYQDDLFYSMFPMTLTRILPQSDIIYELGHVDLDIDYYFYGNIWLVPNRH